MIKITDEIKEDVVVYLEMDYTEHDLNMFSDGFFLFYYRCEQAGMDFADADRYAILNTLLNYDIGMENAMKIDAWMYEHDEEIYELNNSEKSKQLVMLAVEDLGLDIDFSGWIKENYTEYKFFED